MADMADRILPLLSPGGPALPPDVVAVLTEAREALREHEACQLRQDALLTTVRSLLDHAGVPQVAAAGPQELPQAIPLDERIRWLISAAGMVSSVPDVRAGVTAMRDELLAEGRRLPAGSTVLASEVIRRIAARLDGLL